MAEHRIRTAVASWAALATLGFVVAGCGVLNGIDPSFRSPIIVGPGPVTAVPPARQCNPDANPITECIPKAKLCEPTSSTCATPDIVTGQCPQASSLPPPSNDPNAPIIYDLIGDPTQPQLQVVDVNGDLRDPLNASDLQIVGDLTIDTLTTSFSENASLPSGNQEGFFTFGVSNVNPFAIQVTDNAGLKSNRFCAFQ